METTLMNDRVLRSAAFAVSLGLAVPGAVFAQPHGAGHAAPAAPKSPSAKHADGTIRKVDPAAGKLTIAHGPLEGLGMPSMTMAFRVAEKAMLEKVKVGDRIHFVPAHLGGDLIVTSLEVIR